MLWRRVLIASTTTEAMSAFRPEEQIWIAERSILHRHGL